MEALHGAALLAEVIDRHGLSQADAARGLNISRAVLSTWLANRQRPRPELRLAIARWTRGEVPAESWLSDDERAALLAVKPLARRKPVAAPVAA